MNCNFCHNILSHFFCLRLCLYSYFPWTHIAVEVAPHSAIFGKYQNEAAKRSPGVAWGTDKASFRLLWVDCVDMHALKTYIEVSVVSTSYLGFLLTKRWWWPHVTWRSMFHRLTNIEYIQTCILFTIFLWIHIHITTGYIFVTKSGMPRLYFSSQVGRRVWFARNPETSPFSALKSFAVCSRLILPGYVWFKLATKSLKNCLSR